jgi:hypothetical protein
VKNKVREASDATKSHQEHAEEMSSENCQIKEKLGISKETGNLKKEWATLSAFLDSEKLVPVGYCEN